MNNKEINWAEAPEGATHYLMPAGKTYPAWVKRQYNGSHQYKVVIESAVFQSYTDKEWQSIEIEKVLGSGYLITRPHQKPWMPEAGVECERLLSGEWVKVFVAGKTKEGKFILERMNRDIEILSDVNFRPIKTELDEKALSQAIFEAARDSGMSGTWREVLSRVADNLSENHIGWDRKKFEEFGALPADWRRE